MGFFNLFQKNRTASTDTSRTRAPSRRPRRRARYDFVQNLNTAGGRKRAPARIETQGEEGPENLSPRNRLLGINLARNQFRNSPMFRGFVKVLQNNVIGTEGKLRFFSAGDGENAELYRNAERYFAAWAKHCNFRDGSSFRKALKNALAALVIDGDFVCIFDEDLTGSGKLIFFEADQIANLMPADFAATFPEGYSQNSGVVIDNFGRECGVIVSAKRGLTEVAKADAFVLTRDPASDDDSNWILVKSVSRLVQTRGAADCLPSLDCLIDSHEALCAELQSSKMMASRACTIIEGAESTPQGTAPTGFLPDDGEEADGETKEEDEDYYSADALVEYSGGNISILPHDSSIVFDSPTHPNTNLQTFLLTCADLAAAPLGIPSDVARGRADSSYSASRFSQLYFWRNVESIQQSLEDDFMDWVARHVLRYGMARGLLDPLPEGWEEEIAWSFPRMQSINELQDIQSAALKLRTGLTSFARELGPAWRDSLKEYAAELDFCRENGLPLNVFETAAGAMAETQEPAENTEGTQGETNNETH